MSRIDLCQSSEDEEILNYLAIVQPKDYTPMPYNVTTDPDAHHEFMELTAVEQKMHDQLMHSNSQHLEKDDIFVKGANNNSATYGSILTLLDSQWLNDEILHYFTSQFAAHFFDTKNSTNACFFNSFFLSKLLRMDDKKKRGYNYNDVSAFGSKVTGKKSPLSYDKLLFFYNANKMHWVTFVIFPRTKVIECFDSMGGTHTKIIHALHRWLGDELSTKHKSMLDADWKLYHRRESTCRQEDGHNCGVFSICIALFIAKDFPLDGLNKEQVDIARKRMVLQAYTRRQQQIKKGVLPARSGMILRTKRARSPDKAESKKIKRLRATKSDPIDLSGELWPKAWPMVKVVRSKFASKPTVGTEEEEEEEEQQEKGSSQPVDILNDSKAKARPTVAIGEKTVESTTVNTGEKEDVKPPAKKILQPVDISNVSKPKARPSVVIEYKTVELSPVRIEGEEKSGLSEITLPLVSFATNTEKMYTDLCLNAFQHEDALNTISVNSDSDLFKSKNKDEYIEMKTQKDVVNYFIKQEADRKRKGENDADNRRKRVQLRLLSPKERIAYDQKEKDDKAKAKADRGEKLREFKEKRLKRQAKKEHILEARHITLQNIEKEVERLWNRHYRKEFKKGGKRRTAILSNTLKKTFVDSHGKMIKKETEDYRNLRTKEELEKSDKLDASRDEIEALVFVAAIHQSGLSWGVQEYFEGRVNSKGKTKIVRYINPKWAYLVFDPVFLGLVKRGVGYWFPVVVGHTRTEEDNMTAPSELRTLIPVQYNQNGKNLCLFKSIASALHYVGLKTSGSFFSSKAPALEKLGGDIAIKELRKFMLTHAKVVGNCKVFNKRNGRGKKTDMSIDDIVTQESRFITLVVPRGEDGSVNHAVCVVDDLVFDSTQEVALKLTAETLHWICGGSGMKEIKEAYRFNQACGTKDSYTPEGSTKNW